MRETKPITPCSALLGIIHNVIRLFKGRIAVLPCRRFHMPRVYDWRKAGDGLGKYIRKSLFIGPVEIRVWR